jgi:3-phenylpropionate/trans-cinnamate dioxygenase ferredoxin reductase subunit
MQVSLPIVIVGNGGAAIQAIKALRACKYDDEIHLFSDGTAAACNPMLTSYYVEGAIPREQCFPFGLGFEFYKDHGVQLHLGSPVVALDAYKQTIQAAKGGTVCYDKCLVATGSSALVPPIPEAGRERVYALRTFGDGVRLKAALERKPQKALVVGASMVGIKLVDVFVKAGVEVCLADMADHVFPTAAHSDCALIIEDYLRQQAVKLRLGATISGIEEQGEGVRAYFAGQDESEEANLVLLCIGIKPNMNFLDPAQVEMETGVLVDDHMATSAPNLYAAGDVAQGTNLLTGEKEIIALWSNALYQGRTAGRNMAGWDDVFPGGIPQNITRFMNMEFVSIGDPKSDGDVEMDIDPDNYICRRLVRKDEKLTSVNLFNAVNAAGTLRHALVKDSSRTTKYQTSFGGWVSFLNQMPTL